MKNRKLSFIFIAVLAVAALILALDMTGAIDFGKDDAQHVQYKDFIEMANLDEVQSVTIGNDFVMFTSNGKTLKTSNPNYDGFVRDMLEHGIEVTDETKGDDAFNNVMDVVFNVFFIGLIAFGAIKLIQYSRKTFKVVKHTGVRFSDIAGMDGLKKDMM